ncbi:hypothetical protein MTR67_043564 [Solanum verrucosum]|uniref:CCHC-type domain-containing protein n=1 Tax=Solanum verrucosum TaxID=315347 RepID=A0AAF0ZV96_SOLVR|nr:hypothetical protein MTR67_043564 [Solanum verrucosum]
MRTRTGDGNFSNTRSDEQGHPRLRQKFSGQGPSSTPKFNQKRVPNLKSHDNSSEILLPGCSKVDRRHEGECLAGSNVCFGCGNLGYKIRHCHTVARNEGYSHCRYQPYPSSDPIGLGASALSRPRDTL